MTVRTTHLDNWEKFDKEFSDAAAETKRAYTLWAESCARLERIGRLRTDAFKELVASYVADGT